LDRKTLSSDGFTQSRVLPYFGIRPYNFSTKLEDFIQVIMEFPGSLLRYAFIIWKDFKEILERVILLSCLAQSFLYSALKLGMSKPLITIGHFIWYDIFVNCNWVANQWE
jgi:hypothetical protein